jgi:hypothetical protein
MYLASAIRELGVAGNAPRVAAALIERRIQVWDLRTLLRVSDFDSVFNSGGGHRSAMNPSGDICVAAGWIKGIRGGVACYDAITGVQQWHRTDIRQTQYVRFSCDGTYVWVGVDAGRFQKLDAATGTTVAAYVGIKSVWDSPRSNLLLLETRNRGYVIRGARDLSIPRESFALLDASFGSDRLCISEAGGAVRCVDPESGAEVWRYVPEKGHVLRVSYHPSDRHFYGVQWEYERGTSRTLFRFSERGEYEEVCQLRSSWYEEFCENGDKIVTSSGDVISVMNGQATGHLEFPQKKYSQGDHTLHGKWRSRTSATRTGPR